LIKDQYSISEQAISIKDIFWANEVFITSTTKKIMPIVKINNSEIGNGKVGVVSRKILMLYNQEIENKK